ncbi:hypothetical protein O181_005752 [Austropuccinia psidii MF-1]|uniref:Uncharacterized protein n=1 Tax=Austropuccinia psidii MF-1 TaxID=1389203 RepID=A0A9Q3BJD1_9BASI|nr:hypothetical protein [Austropuccinia psidii MF-1]
MAKLQPPFNLSSFDSSHHALPQVGFSTRPVIRYSLSSQIDSLASKPSDQVIVTIPGHGWSIHNVSQQIILSSQKLSPNLVFSSNCIAISIPKLTRQDQSYKYSSKKSTKSRTRYIYAPIASCPSDPSSAVNHGRTVWIWIEHEVKGGFGEPIETNSISKLRHSFKEFPSKVHSIHPLPMSVQKDSSDSISTISARILVLLLSGQLWLCDQNLDTITSCQIHSIHPSTLHSSSQLIRLEAYDNANLQDLSLTSNFNDVLTSNSDSPANLLIYISRLKPAFIPNNKPSADSATPNSRSKKRKSGFLKPSPSNPSLSKIPHYSQIEIDVLEANPNHLCSLGRLSHSQDILDLAIGPQGWVAIIGKDNILSTHQISTLPHSSDTQSTPSDTRLILSPHSNSPPLALASSLQPLEPNPTFNIIPPPSLLPLQSSIPLVFLLIPHPRKLTTCIGLIIDLYHRAVLFVLESTWPSLQKSTLSATSTQAPIFCSATLSSSHQPTYIYLNLTFEQTNLVQVLQLPILAPTGPTWAEVLDPVVLNASLAWLSSDASQNSSLDKTIALSELLLNSTHEPDAEGSQNDSIKLKNIKAFVSQFNNIWLNTLNSSGHWDSKSATKADLLWNQFIIKPLRIPLKSAKHTKPKSKHSHDAPHDNLSSAFGGATHNNDLKPQVDDSVIIPSAYHIHHKIRSRLALLFPKTFLQNLLKMCLQQFIEEFSDASLTSKVDELTSENSNCDQVYYPAQIIHWLLELELIEDNMISGGVLATLRRTRDVKIVGAAISKLLGISESELLETLRWAIHIQSHQVNKNESGKLELDGVDFQSCIEKSHLINFLPQILTQSFSITSLRNAMKDRLDVGEVLIVLKFLKEWIPQLLEIGLEIDSLATKPDGKVLSSSISKKKHEKSRPKIPKVQPHSKVLESNPNQNNHNIRFKVRQKETHQLESAFQFLQCLLDAHFVGLIQHTSAHPILRSLKGFFSQSIERDSNLLALCGPLSEFHLSHQQSTRESKSQLNNNDDIKGEVNVTSDSKETKPNPTNHSSEAKNCEKSLNQNRSQVNQVIGLSARKQMWEANLATGEYSLEQFTL